MNLRIETCFRSLSRFLHVQDDTDRADPLPEFAAFDQNEGLVGRGGLITADKENSIGTDGQNDDNLSDERGMKGRSLSLSVKNIQHAEWN